MSWPIVPADVEAEALGDLAAEWHVDAFDPTIAAKLRKTYGFQTRCVAILRRRIGRALMAPWN